MSNDNNDFSNDLFNISADESNKTRKPIKSGTYPFQILDVKCNEERGWWLTLVIQEGEFKDEMVWLGIPLNVRDAIVAQKQKNKLIYLLWAVVGEKPKAMKKNQIIKTLKLAKVVLSIKRTPDSKYWTWMIPFEENGIG